MERSAEMLGRKDYTREELDHASAAIKSQLAAYKKLLKALPDEKAASAFEKTYFNTLLLALDRPFVHRLRQSTGKDGNPLNEVELVVESLMNNDGIFRGNNVIKYMPTESVTGLEPGDRIALTAKDFERLAD